MLYTNIEQIQLKLKTRLNVTVVPPNSNPPTFPGVSDSITQMSVDPDFIELIIAEEEEYLNLILGQIYKLPLQSGHSILGKIVDGYVLPQILSYMFQGVGVSSILGSDVGGYSTQLKSEANFYLQSLTAGRNIRIKDIPDNMTPGPYTPRALVLPGETLLTQSEIPTIVATNGQTVRSNRHVITAQDLGIFWDDQNTSSYDSNRRRKINQTSPNAENNYGF